jgi:hypothetical protein
VETAVLPDGWRDRLVPIRNQNTGGGTGLCLEIHDLADARKTSPSSKACCVIVWHKWKSFAPAWSQLSWWRNDKNFAAPGWNGLPRRTKFEVGREADQAGLKFTERALRRAQQLSYSQRRIIFKPEVVPRCCARGRARSAS